MTVAISPSSCVFCTVFILRKFHDESAMCNFTQRHHHNNNLIGQCETSKIKRFTRITMFSSEDRHIFDLQNTLDYIATPHSTLAKIKLMNPVFSSRVSWPIGKCVSHSCFFSDRFWRANSIVAFCAAHSPIVESKGQSKIVQLKNLGQTFASMCDDDSLWEMLRCRASDSLFFSLLPIVFCCWWDNDGHLRIFIKLCISITTIIIGFFLLRSSDAAELCVVLVVCIIGLAGGNQWKFFVLCCSLF